MAAAVCKPLNITTVRSESRYHIECKDRDSGYVMRSMVSVRSQDAYYDAIGGSRRSAQFEQAALYAIRTAHACGYASGRPFDYFSYARRLTFEADRFNATPFSSFALFDSAGILIGRIGIGQGYDPKDDISGAGLYKAATNETQLGVMLKPDQYEKHYRTAKHLAIRVAQLFMERGYVKPLNIGDGGEADQKCMAVDRWTFTIVDAKGLKEGDVSPQERALLEFKQREIEALVAAGVTRLNGALLPQSSDPRNYSELPRLVYGP